MREKCQVFCWNSRMYWSVLLAPDILTSMLVVGKQVVPERSVSTSENLRSIFWSLFALSFITTRKKHSKSYYNSDNLTFLLDCLQVRVLLHECGDRFKCYFAANEYTGICYNQGYFIDSVECDLQSLINILPLLYCDFNSRWVLLLTYGDYGLTVVLIKTAGYHGHIQTVGKSTGAIYFLWWCLIVLFVNIGCDNPIGLINLLFGEYFGVDITIITILALVVSGRGYFCEYFQTFSTTR